MFIQGIIIRGTTATHEFSTTYSPSEIKELRVVYGQNGKAVVSKDSSEVKIENKNITVDLTQRDTSLFTSGKNVTIELKIKLVTGQVYSNAMEPICLRVIDSLIEEVLE